MSLAELILIKMSEYLTNDEIEEIASYESDDKTCKEVATRICWEYIPESYRKSYFKYGTKKSDCLESYVREM